MAGVDASDGAILQLAACTGCRACELACSVRLTDSFDPAVSRVKVDVNRRGDHALLYFSGGCDLCGGAVVLECVRWCPPAALTRAQVEGVVVICRGG